MDIGSQVNRTFAPERIPTGGIRTALKLHIKPVTGSNLGDLHTDQFFQSPPGRATGRPANHFDRFQLTIRNLNFEFRGTITFAILSQPDQSGQGTSYWRSRNLRTNRILFCRGHKRYTLLLATPQQFRGKIGVAQKAQHQVRI